MKVIPCKGYDIKVIEDDRWLLSSTRTLRQRQLTIDFSQLPEAVRPWWRALLESVFRNIGFSLSIEVWYGVRWFTRYQSESGTITTHFDSLERLDWGNYAEWLKTQLSFYGRPLSSDSRRTLFQALVVIARQAMILRLPGVSDITLDRLHTVTRSHFKERHAEIQRRIEQRSLTSEQYTDLYAILGEEWQLYQDSNEETRRAVHLPVLVACWLAFNDGVRSCELNTLVVGDVQADPVNGKHRLTVHAPNKRPDILPVDNDTLLLLQALIDAGEETRRVLGTEHLFVSTNGKPCIFTTRNLTYALHNLVRKQESTSLPPDLKFPDGRTTLGTHLAHDIHNRERVRRIMRHQWASTTERYYQAQQKLVVAGNIAKALRADALRLTVACQRPIIKMSEKPGLDDILERNPANGELAWGACGLDVERQGTCRRASHCFSCPLLAPWVSKRHNYVAERDTYLRLADEAQNPRDRENYLFHANQAEAYLILIDRRLKEEEDGTQLHEPTRQRRPRRGSPSQ